jgi:hypothetical protein
VTARLASALLKNEQASRALLYALHSHSGASDRWQERMRRGLTDGQLLIAIGNEFGISGGSSGPGRWFEDHRGGSQPAFECGPKTGDEPAFRLEGVELLKAVRALLEIPPKGQMSLFTKEAQT